MKKINWSFDAVDFLRIIAMFCVVLLHFEERIDPVSFTAYKSTFPLLAGTPAWTAVAIFFFISAYLNIIGFIKGKYQFTLKGILSFYKQRLLRVVLDYYILIFVYFIFFYPAALTSDLETFCRMVFFFHNGLFTRGSPECPGHTWFISVIVQFYLICPLIAYLIYKIKDKKALVITLFFSVLFIGEGLKILFSGLHYQDWHFWYIHFYTSIYGNLDILIAGSLFYLVNSYFDSLERKKYLKIISVVVFSLILISNAVVVYLDLIFVARVIYVLPLILASCFVLFMFPKPVKKPYYYPSKLLVATSYDIYILSI